MYNVESITILVPSLEMTDSFQENLNPVNQVIVQLISENLFLESLKKCIQQTSLK